MEGIDGLTRVNYAHLTPDLKRNTTRALEEWMHVHSIDHFALTEALSTRLEERLFLKVDFRQKRSEFAPQVFTGIFKVFWIEAGGVCFRADLV